MFGCYSDERKNLLAIAKEFAKMRPVGEFFRQVADGFYLEAVSKPGASAPRLIELAGTR
jgi:hypothetical protein